MKKKIVSGIMLTLLLIGMLTLAFDIQPVKADWTWTETIYIRADGSVEPDTAPISSVNNITYTLTDNIVDAAPSWFDITIIVERDNIVLDGAGHTLQGTHADYSKGISLEGRSNVTIKNTNIEDYDHGVYLESTFYSTISENNITVNNHNGIALSESSYNTVSGNSITANEGSGVGLYGLFGFSNNNDIYGNNITNSYYGVYLDYSSNNDVSGNNLTKNHCGIGLLEFSNNNDISGNKVRNNYYGVYLYQSSNNYIYHNNFVDNSEQVDSDESSNVWDDGYPSGGNYWSDYEERYPDAQELDGSGIWDTPYFIDENNQDNYSLMEPWSPEPSTPLEALEELVETIETSDLPKGTENSLTSKLEAAIHLLNKGNENGAIHKLMDFINQVEAQRGKKLTNKQADQLTSEAQRIIDLIKGE